MRKAKIARFQKRTIDIGDKNDLQVGGGELFLVSHQMIYSEVRKYVFSESAEIKKADNLYNALVAEIQEIQLIQPPIVGAGPSHIAMANDWLWAAKSWNEKTGFDSFKKKLCIKVYTELVNSLKSRKLHSEPLYSLELRRSWTSEEWFDATFEDYKNNYGFESDTEAIVQLLHYLKVAIEKDKTNDHKLRSQRLKHIAFLETNFNMKSKSKEPYKLNISASEIESYLRKAGFGYVVTSGKWNKENADHLKVIAEVLEAREYSNRKGNRKESYLFINNLLKANFSPSTLDRRVQDENNVSIFRKKLLGIIPMYN